MDNSINIQNNTQPNKSVSKNKEFQGFGANESDANNTPYQSIQQQANKNLDKQDKQSGKSLPDQQAEASTDKQTSHAIPSNTKNKEPDQESTERSEQTVFNQVAQYDTEEFDKQSDELQFVEHVILLTQAPAENATFDQAFTQQTTQVADKQQLSVELSIEADPVSGDPINEQQAAYQVLSSRLQLAAHDKGLAASILSKGQLSSENAQWNNLPQQPLTQLTDQVVLDDIQEQLSLKEASNLKDIQLEADFDMKQFVLNENNTTVGQPLLKALQTQDADHAIMQDSSQPTQLNTINSNQLGAASTVQSSAAQTLANRVNDLKATYTDHTQPKSDLTNKIMLMISKNDQSANIQLDPPELGHLEIKIAHQDGATNIAFHTSTQLAKEAIESQINDLLFTFQEQGLDLGDVSVFHEEADVSAEQDGQTDGNQTSESDEQEVLQLTMPRSTLIDLYA